MIFIMITAHFVMNMGGLCQNVQQRLTRGPESVPIPALRNFQNPVPVPASSPQKPSPSRTIPAHRVYFSRHKLANVNL